MRKIARTVQSLVLGFGMTALIVACSQPDSVLTTRIKASLAVDSTVKASAIEVTTHDGVVTLTGNVDTQEEKDRALELARSTSGVADVQDMISVRISATRGDAPEPDRSLGEHIDDAMITAAVKNRLLDDPQVKGLRIDVDTREGVVFLTGQVDSKAAMDRAVQLARSTEHVRDVRPNLFIRNG